MAQVIVMIEDLENGQVKVEAFPKHGALEQIENSGNELTAAQGYALRMMNIIWMEAKGMGKSVQLNANDLLSECADGLKDKLKQPDKYNFEP